MSQTTQVRPGSAERATKSQRAQQGSRRRTKPQAVRSPLSWGSAFCGWCAAVGLAALLAATVSLAATAVVMSQGGGALLTANAPAFCLMGGLCFVFCLSFAFYVGGYVAGRMARFEGGRHGLGVWLAGVAIAIALSAASAFAAINYNLYEGFTLPRLPIAGNELIAGGAGVLVITALTTLGGAIHGGRTGARLHGIIDLAGVPQG